MNIFKGIAKVFKAIGKFIFSPAARERVADALAIVQNLLENGWAMKAVEAVAAATPTRADNELLALVKHYGLGFVTPDMLRNEALVNGLLKRAAIYELKKLTGVAISNTVLDMAIQAAYLAYKENKEDKP